jgi:hypothetical protein
MIQRIQSIYLLLIVICQSLLFADDLVIFRNPELSFSLNLFGFYKLTSAGEEILLNNYSLMAVNIIVMIFSMFIIFSFKNRKNQLKLAAFNLVLISSFIVLMFFSFDNAKSSSYNTLGSEYSTNFGIVLILPILSLIFNFLAIKGIRKDEELVKSADRIR